VDVRVVAATNRELSEAIARGRFREDLYYRLAVVEIGLPALRARPEDVTRLALYFASHFVHRYGRSVRLISRRALERLEAYAWPGNVRELRNVMDRAVLLSSGDVIRSSALRLGVGAPSYAARATSGETGYPATHSLADVEADHIERVLRVHGGQLTAAAEVLGIHRNTLRRKLREYEIGPPSPREGR
jgi:Nif-specific regulatory protein